jgi:hypothetical protein
MPSIEILKALRHVSIIIDHHQGVHVFLVKVTDLKCELSRVVMRQHNITYIQYKLRCRIATRDNSHFNSVTLIRNA